MTPQEGKEKDRKDSLEVKWIVILTAITGLFVWGYTNLDNRKLDRAVYEEASRNMLDMKDDLRAIRKLMDQHAFRMIDGKER